MGGERGLWRGGRRRKMAADGGRSLRADGGRSPRFMLPQPEPLPAIGANPIPGPDVAQGCDPCAAQRSQPCAVFGFVEPRVMGEAGGARCRDGRREAGAGQREMLRAGRRGRWSFASVHAAAARAAALGRREPHSRARCCARLRSLRSAEIATLRGIRLCRATRDGRGGRRTAGGGRRAAGGGRRAAP